MSDEIEPYQINVADSALADLKARLANTRWPEKETVDDWSQGIPLDYVQTVCGYWADEYDWRATERRINRYPQYVSEIDGLDVHFLHVRSEQTEAKPLVLTHGWPGSVVEFLKVIEPLVDPAAHGGNPEDAFHCVIPSLPGYGFSGKPTRPGWSVEKIAAAWARLMARLGYNRYLAQGGDWGSAVTTAIGFQDPEHCAGIHINLPTVGPGKMPPAEFTEQERAAVAASKRYQEDFSGYSKEQSTRPQTIGYGLVDSPSGQAAWILEKFYEWTDCDGHPENVLTRDELLDNVMFYWLTGAGASSARLYWESFGKASRELVNIPSGCSIFPKEIFRASRRWMERRFTNLVYYNEADKGGHFAAFEQPEHFVTELRACFLECRCKVFSGAGW